MSNRYLMPSTSTQVISFGGPSPSGSELRWGQLSLNPPPRTDPKQGVPTAFLGATSGGNVNLAFWTDEPSADAQLRFEALGLMLNMPSPCLGEAFECLTDIWGGYFDPVRPQIAEARVKSIGHVSRVRDRAPLVITD